MPLSIEPTSGRRSRPETIDERAPNLLAGVLSRIGSPRFQDEFATEPFDSPGLPNDVGCGNHHRHPMLYLAARWRRAVEALLLR